MDLFRPVWEMLTGFAAVAMIAWGLRWLSISSEQRLQNRARELPVTFGTVEHAEPKMVGEGRTGYWVGELSYSYSVDGEYYAGVAELSASSEDSAWDSVEGWKGRRIRVRYLPSDPAKSVLVIDEQDKPTPASV
jgi:Protein of unknown function (DUF3592)